MGGWHLNRCGMCVCRLAEKLLVSAAGALAT
jgi:hypothetical protein